MMMKLLRVYLEWETEVQYATHQLFRQTSAVRLCEPARSMVHCYALDLRVLEWLCLRCLLVPLDVPSGVPTDDRRKGLWSWIARCPNEVWMTIVHT